MGHPKDRAAALDFRAVLIGADNASGAAGVSTLRGLGRGSKARLGLVAGLALDLPPHLALPLADNLRDAAQHQAFWQGQTDTSWTTEKGHGLTSESLRRWRLVLDIVMGMGPTMRIGHYATARYRPLSCGDHS